MVIKNFLKSVHMTIMREKRKKRNSLIPSRLRARELKCRRHIFYAQKYVDGAKGDVSGNGMYRRGKRSIIKRKNKKRGVVQ